VASKRKEMDTERRRIVGGVTQKRSQNMSKTIMRAAMREGSRSLRMSADKMDARGHAVVARDLRALAEMVEASR